MNFKKLFALFLMAAVSVALLGGYMAMAGEAETIAKADELYKQEKFEESNKTLMELVKVSPNNADVYWMIGRNFYYMGNLIPLEKDKTKKLQMYLSCEQWARKGVEKNPKLADNSFWLAVGLGMQGQVNGIASTLLSNRTLAKQIETYFIGSTQAKEFHYREENTNTISSAYLALGMFYRKIPDSALVKLLTGTKGDINKSVDCMRKAVALFPKNLEFNKELGVSLVCRGNKTKNRADIDEGIKYLKATIALPLVKSTDKIEVEDAKKLIADPSLACGYSRVQQEEVTDSQLKK